MRLAILTSHPIQYYAPLFRELAKRIETHVFFAHKATAADQSRAGFGTAFEWDVDLTSGYPHEFLTNVARDPGTHHFLGCDTPEISRRLKCGGFDALLVMGWHLKSYVQAIFAARRLGLPVMVRGDSHLETPRSALKRSVKELAFPHLLRVFGAALYVGQRSRAYYEHYDFPPERLHFSPHCVDSDWFASRATDAARERLRAELAVGETTKLVLFAGRLLPFKRPLDLVAAMAHCRKRHSDAALLIAGDGELRGSLEDAASSANVPLHLVGFRNQSEMPQVYAASDCLVLPSDARETWGLVANEAIACGRPVILSDACGSAADIGVDGRCGRSYPMGDIDALARAIGDVLAAPPSPDEIARIAALYSLERAADGIVAGLRSVSANRRQVA